MNVTTERLARVAQAPPSTLRVWEPVYCHRHWSKALSKMLRYVATHPNPGAEGKSREISYEDTPEGHARAKAFAARWNIPGQAVYDTVNLFKDDATARNLDNVAAIAALHFDTDFKNIEEDPATAERKILELPYPPSELRRSGHGLHGLYIFKEPIEADSAEAESARALRTRLIEFLCADTNQNHDAGLLRRPGSTNGKDPANPQTCTVAMQTGHTYDPVDIADLLDDCAGRGPLLTRKKKEEKPRGNGHDKEEYANNPYAGPVDVEAEFASMRYGGQDNNNVNEVHKRVIPSLLQRGTGPEEVITTVVDATMATAERDGLGWDRDVEIKTVTARCVSTLRWLQREHDYAAAGQTPPWLPPKLLDAWAQAIVENKRPLLCRNRTGWHVRAYAITDNADQPDSEADREAETRQAQSRADDGAGANKTKPNTPHRIHPKAFACFNFASIPLREWLYGGHYMRGIASATIGPGGSGKSSLDLVEAIAMATARNLLGEQPAERMRIWYHNGEDGTDELNRRIAAICVHYKITPHELEGSLFVTSGLEMPVKIAGGNGEVKLDTSVAKAIAAGIQENAIDVLILDPLITLHRLSEAENHKMDPVIREFARIANETNCSIELVHHTRKKGIGQDEYTTADARGATAIIDAVRSARIINGLSNADASLLGIDDELERLSYFRLDKGKANMTRRGPRATSASPASTYPMGLVAVLAITSEW